jgi:hypothetical protein
MVKLDDLITIGALQTLIINKNSNNNKKKEEEITSCQAILE